ncbi:MULTISPECIES: hypothetical protein [unclassified Xanthobacter]|uniref:hypothetical protein n=2 Tax=Xanthobacter TaxID=279 RepID=UPI001F433B12|nr:MULTISPECIES: hypothetical protein [unclassified Xanthobacter]
MVTGVSNNSANILTLFQTGKEAGTANNEETLAKIQELAKEAEQMKAGTSPAQTQGASVATNAWIDATETAQQPTSTTTETPSSTEGSKPKVYAIQDPRELAEAIKQYNGALLGIDAARAKLEENKALLAAATDGHDIDRLTSVVELNLYIVSRAENLLTDSPTRIERAADEMYEKWNVGGSILTKNDDGTYGMGQFDINLKDNGIRTYYSDDNGAIWENKRHSVSESDSWGQIAQSDKDGTRVIRTSPNS